MSAALQVFPSPFTLHPNGLLDLLVVDDERPIRDACCEVAELLGFHAHAAENSAQALRILTSRTIDVVLLDLRLHGPDGMQLLAEIKRRRPETLVIMITGFASVDSAVSAMRQGAYDFVAKPFNLEELRTLLERAAGRIQFAEEEQNLR